MDVGRININEWEQKKVWDCVNFNAIEILKVINNMFRNVNIGVHNLRQSQWFSPEKLY